MRTSVLCLGLLMTSMTGSLASAQPFALDDALALAYDTNPQLAAQQASLRATDEGVARANAGWRPQIAAQGSYGAERFGFTPFVPSPGAPTIANASEHPVQGEVTVTEPIFSYQTYAQIRQAKALVRAGRAQLIDTEQSVLLSAVGAYMDVVRDSAIVELRRANVSLLMKQRDSTQAEFRAGSLTRTDVAQSEARLAGAQSDLTTAEGQLAVSRATFLQTIGQAPETLETDPRLPKLPANEADVIGLATKQFPQLIAAEENERAAEFGVDSAYGAMTPNFSVQGQYFYSHGSLTQSIGVAGSTDHGVAILGLVNVPIYQGGAEYATVRQQEELREQASKNVDVARRQAEQSATSAWQLFQSAQSTIASNQATMTADESAFQGVSREQQVGGRTILDVLNAQQELLNAQVAVVTSKRDRLVAAFQVLAATGGLTATDLRLKVKLYDPVEHYEDDESRWIGFGG